jgi:hypothetical protein
LKRGRIAVAVGVVAAGLAAWWVVGRPSTAAGASPRVVVDRDTMRLVPPDVRVKIEVLNASGQRGLARRAMHYLRDRGFDVVSLGNSSERVDSSVVIDLAGNPEWAALAARALGGARVESRPDESRYLHLTVLLGARFRAPPQVLYP